MPKLDADNVLKAVLSVVAIDPSIPEEKRDGLPVIAIDGVKCAVDGVNAVIQAGEGKEQRWFEVALFDVTPRRFLDREEQEELLYGEQDEWWNVTSPQRMAFVRARSRSKAMQYFAAKFHERPADCELARGFEFVDPTKEELPEEVVLPDPNFGPVEPEKADGGGPAESKGMRIVVDFPITDADDEVQMVHADEFEFDMNDQAALDAIQSVVDEWESKGVTVDQGGDAKHYELSLPDGCEALELDATMAQARQILDDVARALRDAGVSSAPAIPDDPAPPPEAEAAEEPEEGLEKTEAAGDDGVEPEFRNLRPQDYYFGVGGGGGGQMDEEAWLMICPKSYWDANQHCYDGYLGDVWKMFPEYLQSPEDMECTWMLPDGKMTEDVAIDMAVLGFERNFLIDDLIAKVQES